MKEFQIADLARIIKARLDAGSWIPDTRKTRKTRIEHRGSSIKQVFTGVSTDSRSIKPGDCFFAIIGENFDGHDYLSDAFAKGAACTVLSKDTDKKESGGKALLKVDDTVKALGDFAREYRRRLGFKVVAITGSVGKTTTRQIAYHVLSRHFRVLQSPKNFNNYIGLPLTLLAAEPNDQIVIAELATNHPGEIAHLTRIAAPDIAVVTNVYPAHLEGLGNLQTIIQEKLSIAEGLPPHGVLLLNADFSQLTKTCRAKGAPFLTFGKIPRRRTDYQAKNISFDGRASRFTINNVQIQLPLAGPGNVENTLAAWAVCDQFGLALDDFAQAVKTVPPISMRSELLQIGTLTLLNDCYNANPGSMKNALDTLRNLDPDKKRRLVFICGDMAELGHQAELLHAELGTRIAQTGVKLLLTVGDLAKVAARSAKNTAKYVLQIECFQDNLSACNNLHKFIKDYDIILVKGSRVAGLEMTVRKLTSLFS